MATGLRPAQLGVEGPRRTLPVRRLTSDGEPRTGGESQRVAIAATVFPPRGTRLLSREVSCVHAGTPSGTTVTGQGAWSTQPRLVEPMNALETAPRPRWPTTSASACSAS